MWHRQQIPRSMQHPRARRRSWEARQSELTASTPCAAGGGTSYGPPQGRPYTAAGGAGHQWAAALGSVVSAMSRPPTTLLVTLTGRDRPGVTSRLFSGLSAHELTVLDVEQVVIRGHLVLGVLLACPAALDLTAVHKQVTDLADDLGMNVEITLGSGEHARQRGRLHVTVLGNPLLPGVIAAIAGRIAASGANIDKIRRLAKRPLT